MTKLEDLSYKPCEKLDGACVEAYLELRLGTIEDEDPATLYLDSTWGTTSIDLTPAVKAAETQTSMQLAPLTEPVKTALQYDSEDGTVYCIEGVDLARIIPMARLRDVAQNEALRTGDVYMYQNEDSLFHAFNLQDFIDSVDTRFEEIGGDTANLLVEINKLKNRVTRLENLLEQLMTRPAGVPEDTSLVWGSINCYGDSSNTDQKTSGLYSHAINIDKTNDLYFA